MRIGDLAIVAGVALLATPDRPLAIALGGTAGVMVGASAMGYAVQTFGFWAAWLFVGALSTLAFVGTAFMRGEEELR